MLMLCGLLLVLAILLSLPLGPGFGWVHALVAPGRAGAGIRVVLLTLPRWLALGVVLGVLASRGHFGWAGSTPATQTSVVLGLHVGFGVLSAALFSIAARGVAGGDGGRLPVNSPLLITFLLPMFIVGYAAMTLFLPDFRVTGIKSLPNALLVGVAALGGFGVLRVAGESLRAAQRRKAAAEKEELGDGWK